MHQQTGLFAWKYSHYFELVCEKHKNITVKCQLCPGDKRLSTARNSTSNLKRHLQVKHGADALVVRTPTEEQGEAGGATARTRQRLTTGSVTPRLRGVDRNTSGQPSQSVSIHSHGHQEGDMDREQICVVEVALEKEESETHTTLDKSKINSAISGILEAVQGHPAEQAAHGETRGDGENPPARRVRAKRSLIWRHFESLDTLRAACCHICEKKIKFNETGGTGNMRRHVSKTHPQVYARLLTDELKSNSSQVSNSNGDTAGVEVALEDEDSEDNPPVKRTWSRRSLIWKYFKRLNTLNAACCHICKKKIKCKGTGNMRRHMSKRHRQLFAKLVAEELKLNSLNSSHVSNTHVDTAGVELTPDDDDSEIQSESYHDSATNGISENAKEHSEAEASADGEVCEDDDDNPPVRRTRSKRSLIWRHFERLDILNAGRCHICKKKIHCNKDGGTGNMRRHMAKRHPYVFSQLVAEELEPNSLSSSHVSKSNGDTSTPVDAGELPNGFEGERRALRREREFTEALRRTQKAEAQALEQQRELLEKLRTAHAREAAAERETIESLRKAQQEEAKELGRQREELQKEKTDIQEKREELQQEREELLLFSTRNNNVAT